MSIIFIMLQKHSAELKKTIKSSDGSALSVLIIGLMGLLVTVIILLQIIDVSIYSYKKVMISQAINYGVSAAIQEIDIERSKKGLAKAFTSNGIVSMNDIYLDESKADKAFISTFAENIGKELDVINVDLVRMAATPTEEGIYYSLKDRIGIETGIETSMEKIEGLLNNRMNTLGIDGDRHTVFVNDNDSTNAFERRPYYMVFIRDYQINGLFTNRKATFIGFKSAKIFR